jgi:hypothetical protein
VRRRNALVLALALALALVPVPTPAQSFGQAAFTVFTTNVTLVTTAETVIVSSGPATAPRQSVNVCIMAWAQLTTGTMTSAVTPRIRRGTLTSGTLVGEANAETILAAAGSTEKYFLFTCEDRADVATVEYSLTLEQTAASANGTALQGGILVLVR